MQAQLKILASCSFLFVTSNTKNNYLDIKGVIYFHVQLLFETYFAPVND